MEALFTLFDAVQLSVLADAVVAVLLVLTIVYAFRLNRRLSLLRRDRAKLETLAKTFASSSRRAGETLNDMRSYAKNMRQDSDSAKALAEDLRFLVERAESSAGRLEEAIRETRAMTHKMAQERPQAPVSSHDLQARASRKPATQPAARKQSARVALDGVFADKPFADAPFPDTQARSRQDNAETSTAKASGNGSPASAREVPASAHETSATLERAIRTMFADRIPDTERRSGATAGGDVPSPVRHDEAQFRAALEEMPQRADRGTNRRTNRGIIARREEEFYMDDEDMDARLRQVFADAAD